MKKIIIILIVFILLFGVGIYIYNVSNNPPTSSNSNYNATRTSFEDNTTNTTIQEENVTISKPEPPREPIETEIASYTTKIYTKDPDRQNNVTIACSTLNDTIVESGSTFSFSDTLGKATKSKGYEKASVFQDGKEIEALGGGKCQVSSTLYNAVLKIPELEVVERHPHSGQVYYVPKGKDAAVAYGSYDFKFQNNTGNSIKIKASNTPDELKVTLLKLE